MTAGSRTNNAADALPEPPAGAVEDGPVHVGLGVEVSVEQDPGDAGFGRDVVQPGGGEPGARECAGGGVEDLSAPVGPAKPAYRLGRRGSRSSFAHEHRYCIGAPLARMELEAVFSQLVPRFPDMRLSVPAEELAVNTGTLTGGLLEIPVTW
jgi:hypothetical protein